MINLIFKNRQNKILFCLLVSIFTLIILSLGIGYSSVSFDRLIPTLLGNGTFKETFVIFSIRFPKIIILILTGAALSLSGAILQTITKNDLADPGIIGINSGAGVAITILFLFIPVNSQSFIYILPLIAFLGALVTALLIYLFSYEKHYGINPQKMLLVGIGFSMALSGLMILLVTSSERSKLEFITKWLNGSIWGNDWSFVWAILPWIIILIPYSIYKSNCLNILTLKKETAISLGINLNKERTILFLIAISLASISVAVTGALAFIGLIAPHLAKILTSSRAQSYIPVTILIGILLLLTSDFIGRNILKPQGIPTGIILSIIGAPYFIYLIYKNNI